MSIEIRMTDLDQAGLRAEGTIRERGKQTELHEGIVSRVGPSTKFDVPTGKYTYVFGIDRKGSFTLTAVDVATGAALGASKPYTNALKSDVLRYFFEVK